jgi:competence protein ComEC
MPVYGIVYLAAVFVVAYLRDLPSITMLLTSLILLFVSLLLFKFARVREQMSRLEKIIKSLYLFSFIFIITALHSHYLLSELFDDTGYTRECVVTGTVIGIVQHPTKPRSNVTRFKFKPSQTQCGENELRLNTLSLSLYNKYLAKEEEAKEVKKIYAGDKLKLQVKLKTPRSHFSESVFDFKLWAINNTISATGYVREIISIEKDYSYFYSVRDRLARHIAELSISEQAKASLNALVLGNKVHLTEQQWQWLRATGTVHLLVVSGLHIAVVVTIGWWFGVALRSLLQMLNSISKSALRLTLLPEFFALSLSFSYMLLAGAGLSTQRAWLMAFIMLLGNSFSHSITLWQRWWLALIIIISWQPLSVLSPGLWLSFFAVASLICLQGLRAQNPKWSLLLASQFGVWFALMPLLLLFFQQLSLISPFVNIVAISYVSIMVVLLVPALALSVLNFSDPLRYLALFIDYFWQVLAFISQYSQSAVVKLFALEKEAVVILAIACLCLLLPLSNRLKSIALVSWLLVAFPRYPSVEVEIDHFRLTVIDVGQGLAVLVQTQKNHLLYDTGASFASGFNYFERNVKPLLDSQQLVQLDRLVISHTDNDHSGGLSYAQQQLTIKQLDSEISSLPNVEHARCESNQRWQWQGIDFHYRHPEINKKVKTNNRSCVLQVSNAQCSVLIMGDAERLIEKRLLVSQVKSTAKVLVVGHHGSNTSTSQYLLDKEQFKGAIISNGYANRYGHPHSKVLDRLKQNNVEIYRTDLEGSIELVSDKQGCKISTYRLKNKRFWW